MKAVSLKVFSRTLTRRGGAKRLRSQGRVPAVIYGRSSNTRNLELNAKSFGDLMQHSASETILVDLEVEGESGGTELALVQEIQHHPLTGRLLHVDFHRVAADEPVVVTIPVETVGVAAGVKAGGILEHVLFKIKLRGLPRDLPEVVEVDVSPLNIGESVHLQEIKLPDGVTAVGDPSIPVITMAAPLTEAQEQAATDEAGTPLAEPEMLKEKKEGETAPSPAAEKKK